MLNNNLLTRLLPHLATRTEIEFNVFDVLHHGTHEKQLSNGFRWILEIGGTHNFEDLGQRVFIEILNSMRPVEQPLPAGPYSVRQEVNTSAAGDQEDIADIVLEGESAVIVIENFHTSDGHGHGYETYLQYGRRGGKASTVVLLCAEEDRALLTLGWEQARVITYEQFLTPLFEALEQDSEYASRNPDQFAFIRQMYLKLSGRNGRMDNQHNLDFVVALCETGEANRYGGRNKEMEAESFANAMAQQARENFNQGRETLQSIKKYLKNFGENSLRQQLHATLGFNTVTRVTIEYSGIYQWNVNFQARPSADAETELLFQIKFGPSAWHANEADGQWEANWETRVDPELVDYSRLFITDIRRNAIIQSSVSLHDVLSGLTLEDTRLHDEIIEHIRFFS